MNKQLARGKLIRTFFWIVREAGMSDEERHSFVESIYPKGSLRQLTTDELKRVVDELVARTGVTPRKPPAKQPGEREDLIVRRGNEIIELPSRNQLAMIEFHADKMAMTQETLRRMIARINGDKSPALTFMGARILIEALKGMHARGWKDKNVDPPPAAGKGH